MSDFANAETVRAIVEPTAKAAASAAIREFVQTHPHWQAPAPKAEIPAPLKIAAGVVTALMTAAVIALSFWVVSTLNELQLTVARIDTRQQTDTTGKRLDAVEQVNTEQTERIAALEQGKRK